MNDAVSASERAQRLVGASISQLRIAQHDLALDFASDGVLIVEASLRASSPSGAWRGEPTAGGSVDALRPLLNQPVTAATVGADGSIRLDFEEGVIEVQSNAAYEAWQLWAPDDSFVVCLPGGSYALWGPPPTHAV